MFQVRKTQTGLARTLAFFELLYHSIVRGVRKSGSTNVILSLLSQMVQALTFVLAFMFLFNFIGMRGSAIRGDFMLYIMSGIFVFLIHTQAMSAVFGSEGPTSAMMNHAPMNTMIAILAAAFTSLYTQVLTLTVILFCYHVVFTPIEVYDPIGALGMVLLAWFTGCAVGMLLLSAKPWNPGLTGLISTIYMRVNMFASGKMFVANALPSFMLAMFDWNPLFHVIDQMRGYVFINYNPHHSSSTYALTVGITLISIGLIGEHYTRKHASESWSRTG